MPYLQVLSEFREGVRQIAREKKGENLLFPVLLHMRFGGCGTGEDRDDLAVAVSLLRE